MSKDSVVILTYARTPIGGFMGDLSSLKSTQLGAIAVRAAVTRAKIEGELLDQIVMGCVLSSGLEQAPARQAALEAGLPQSVQATTLNKMCGSSMQAAIIAADALAAASIDFAVVGGMESMSNAPYLLGKHRSGARIGHDTVKDSMFLDGLEDAYEPGKLMGAFADDSAQQLDIVRQGDVHRGGRPKGAGA